MNPVAVARTTTAPDGVLLQEAAAGGGASYAALYDRYAEQVYNYCLRLTGSPEDAADATQDAFVNVLGRLHKDDSPVLDFSSYLFAAARNESYALMRRRTRTQPSDEPPERAAYESDVETDPERAVLLRDSQESVRLANAQLAPRHREVLALREVAGRSYEEIGQIMGISENAAAQLIWRARSKLRGALTAGAVASVVATSEDCETAQVLINRLQDGEPVTDAEHEWLEDHLDECQRCRASRGMIFEVATSYRLWAPVALLATMKADVLAAAGSVVGANWTTAHVAAGGSGASGGGAGGSGAAHAGAAHAGSGASGGGASSARRAIREAAAGSAGGRRCGCDRGNHGRRGGLRDRGGQQRLERETERGDREGRRTGAEVLVRRAEDHREAIGRGHVECRPRDPSGAEPHPSAAAGPRERPRHDVGARHEGPGQGAPKQGAPRDGPGGDNPGVNPRGGPPGDNPGREQSRRRTARRRTARRRTRAAAIPAADTPAEGTRAHRPAPIRATRDHLREAAIPRRRHRPPAASAHGPATAAARAAARPATAACHPARAEPRPARTRSPSA